MIELLKTLIALVMRAIIWIFSGFTKINQKQILFDSHNGKQYSCNPRAIYEYMIAEKMDYEYVWAFKDPTQYKSLENNFNTKICKYRSFAHLYYFITSRFIVSNVYKPAEYPLRKSQEFMQTWHGFPFKTVALARGSKIHKWVIKQHITGTSAFVSCCRHFSEIVIRKDFNFTGKILNIGMPRNDILINTKDSNLNQAIKEKIGINKEALLVLYAPTYAETNRNNVERINLIGIRKAVEERFNKNVVIAFRGHQLQPNNTKKTEGEILNLDYYPDMQELLIAADILITDYSSSMWDYSFTGKPCFLFTPDIQEYENKRGFEVNVQDMGFPVCKTNEELILAIESYDKKETYKKVRQFHEIMGSYEKGTATKKACDYINLIIEGSHE